MALGKGQDTKGKNNPFYGCNHTDISKERQSNARKRLWQDPSYRTMMISVLKGRKFSEEIKANWTSRMKGMFGKKHTEKTKKKQSNAHKGKKYPINLYPNRGWCNKKRSPKTCDKISKKMKEKWENNLDYKDKQRSKILKSCFKRPTRPEREVIVLIKKHKFPFGYTGNGKVMINGHCPDFTECNGKKLLIEVNGVYWHTIRRYGNDTKEIREKEEMRIDEYTKDFGYRTLHLWDDELVKPNWEKQILFKIQEFVEMKQ